MMSDLGDIASATECSAKNVLSQWVMQMFSDALQKHSAEMYRRLRLVLSRQQGIRDDPGLDLPVRPDWAILFMLQCYAGGWVTASHFHVTRLWLMCSDLAIGHAYGKIWVVMCR